MLDIVHTLISELGLHEWQIRNALTLFAEGATVPFVARYRKERTGEMDEVQLRSLLERHTYLTELEDRKRVVLESIEQQGALTDELRERIEACLTKTELEDLYLPYKPRKRTRATIARERGLAPLAEQIAAWNTPDTTSTDLLAAAAAFVNEEAGVPTAADALAGASDILAEDVSERAELRSWVRAFFVETGVFHSTVKSEFPAGTTKFEMYRDFSAPVQSIAPHSMLAMRRGEHEGVLLLELQFNEEAVLARIEGRTSFSNAGELREFWRGMCTDAFRRLMKNTLVADVRLEKKTEADVASIRAFGENLRELLLAPPAGMKPTLGIDPGFRTGCKCAVVDHTGKLVEYRTIHPHTGEGRRAEAADQLRDLLHRHGSQLVAIGNGTAGRETQAFVIEALRGSDLRPVVVLVNESGASIYSASEVAIEEFPDLDLTVRGAVSIARRLQDPLAELVKIDPKSIGVGQYQHDVDQRALQTELDATVESCVNYVGVDLNLASKKLLSYVSGLSPSIAKNIVERRDTRGPYRSRAELLEVPRFGPKAFEQSAGFLRIRGGDHPLDNTAVHPESYHIVEDMARDLGIPVEHIGELASRARSIDAKRYVRGEAGEPTIRDILRELEKPGRDPRAEFRSASFKENVNAITDLVPDMVLEGVVTNVANFGAFVDIGVHQDGLVHISQLADRFVKDPRAVVKVGQVVTVRVLEVNLALKRIALSMKSRS